MKSRMSVFGGVEVECPGCREWFRNNGVDWNKGCCDECTELLCVRPGCENPRDEGARTCVDCREAFRMKKVDEFLETVKKEPEVDKRTRGYVAGVMEDWRVDERGNRRTVTDADLMEHKRFLKEEEERREERTLDGLYVYKAGRVKFCHLCQVALPSAVEGVERHMEEEH